MKNEDFFLGANRFAFINAIRKGPELWSPLEAIPALIATAMKKKGEPSMIPLEGYGRIERIYSPDGSCAEVTLTMERSVILSEELVAEKSISVGAGTFLEAGAIIKAPALIGAGCEIRHGAYLRGNVIVGRESVIGHVTEVKNAIIMDHSAAGHFAYVGDAILGSYVNLGAGTKIANLQFRSRSELDQGRINGIVMRHARSPLRTGITKLGAIIGDYSEIGCNSVTSPATFIGAESWIYPNCLVPKGYYEPGKVWKNGQDGVLTGSDKP